MSTLTFDVIDKNTPDFLAKIDKKELTLLVHMLEDLEHSATASTKQAYGYHEDTAKWDEQKLAAYKAGTLNARMLEKNYTFFVLRDQNNEVVALASGNAPDDKSQLRVLNIAVDRNARGQGHATELMKQLADWAAQKEFAEIAIPLSEHAIAKGNVDVYQHIAQGLGLEAATRPHPDDAKSIELTVAPKRLIAVAEPEAAEKKHPRIGGRTDHDGITKHKPGGLGGAN